MELSKELHPLKTEDISWIIEEAYESVRVGTYTNTAAATRVDGRVHVYKAGSMEPGYSSATVEGDPPPSVLHYKGAGTGFQPNLDNELKDALRYIAGE